MKDYCVGYYRPDGKATGFNTLVSSAVDGVGWGGGTE